MRWRRRTGVAIAVVVGLFWLGGCGGQASDDGRFTGSLPGCGPATATLIRSGGRFAFSPSDGALTIYGAVAADGGFEERSTRNLRTKRRSC